MILLALLLAIAGDPDGNLSIISDACKPLNRWYAKQSGAIS